MRYFKHDNLNLSEIMTFEDREYLNLVFYFLVSNIIGLQGTDESINIWLERTKAVEMPKETVDSIIAELESKIQEVIAEETPDISTTPEIITSAPDTPVVSPGAPT